MHGRVTAGLIAALLVPAASAQAAPFAAALKAPTPKAGAVWPITVTARTSSGRRSAPTTYQFIFNGSVVATRYRSPRPAPVEVLEGGHVPQDALSLQRAPARPTFLARALGQHRPDLPRSPSRARAREPDYKVRPSLSQ
jgi:hypothetical protein